MMDNFQVFRVSKQYMKDYCTERRLRKILFSTKFCNDVICGSISIYWLDTHTPIYTHIHKKKHFTENANKLIYIFKLFVCIHFYNTI